VIDETIRNRFLIVVPVSDISGHQSLSRSRLARTDEDSSPETDDPVKRLDRSERDGLEERSDPLLIGVIGFRLRREVSPVRAFRWNDPPREDDSEERIFSAPDQLQSEIISLISLRHR
jgi:hypothetical protein